MLSDVSVNLFGVLDVLSQAGWKQGEAGGSLPLQLFSTLAFLFSLSVHFKMKMFIERNRGVKM